MTYTLSGGDLWTTGQNVVCALPPCKSDEIVVTMVNGKVSLTHAVTEYERAVRIANAFARRIRGPRGVVIKVMSLSLQESDTFSVMRHECYRADPDQLGADRQLVTSTLSSVSREAFDPAIKAAALKTPEEIGELPCA